ncbi:MAG: hypothetical protein HOJ35_04215 [Bdellovibrionales bacterium]|jgi:hypothetical protein|nr:hypothetical protein [Bdellovibrionales bacterium]
MKLYILLFLFSINISANEEIDLKDWSIYNKNKYFDSESIIKSGVKDRQKLINKRKENLKIVTISDELCNKSLIQSSIKSKQKTLTVQESEICLKAINYSTKTFHQLHTNISQPNRNKLLKLLADRKKFK